jgi:hypothetical protein
MESMQERGRRERDIVVPRATCAAALASTQNEFFLPLSPLLVSLLAFLDLRCRIFFFYSPSSP